MLPIFSHSIHHEAHHPWSHGLHAIYSVCVFVSEWCITVPRRQRDCAERVRVQCDKQETHRECWFVMLLLLPLLLFCAWNRCPASHNCTFAQSLIQELEDTLLALESALQTAEHNAPLQREEKQNNSRERERAKQKAPNVTNAKNRAQTKRFVVVVSLWFITLMHIIFRAHARGAYNCQ